MRLAYVGTPTDVGRRLSRPPPMTSRLAALALPLAVGCTSASSTPVRDAAPAIALANVTVIDGTGAAPRPGMTVVVRDGRILSVSPAESAAIPDGAKVELWVIPLRDMYLGALKAGANVGVANRQRLALFGLVGVVGTTIVVGRRRGIRSIGFASAALG